MSRHTEPLRHSVAAFMRAHPILLRTDATVSEAVDVLDVYQVVGVPVVNDQDKYVGMLSSVALLALLSKPPQDRGTDAGIGPVVRHDSPTLSPSDPMTVAATFLAGGEGHLMPVVEDGQVIGTIGHAEVCRYLCSVCSSRHAEHDESGT